MCCLNDKLPLYGQRLFVTCLPHVCPRLFLMRNQDLSSRMATCATRLDKPLLAMIVCSRTCGPWIKAHLVGRKDE